MKISRRTEAEARRVCERGLAAYISDRHSVYLNRSLAYGVIGGLVPASYILIYSAFKPLSWYWSVVPLAVGVASGFGYGVFTSDSTDIESQNEFEIVCDSLQPEEEEEVDNSDLPEQQ